VAGSAPTAPTTAPAPSPPPPAPPATAPPPASSAYDPALAPLVPTGQHTASAAPPPDAPPTSDYPPSVPPPPEPFGTAGRFVITGSFALSAGFTGHSPSDATSFSVRFVPALDYFVARNLSLGGFVLGTYDNATTSIPYAKIDTTTSAVGLGVSVGYNVPISQLFSWWLRSELAFALAHRKNEGTLAQGLSSTGAVSGSSTDEEVLVASLYLPFLLHPVPHFFIGFGPEAFYDLVHKVGAGDDQRFHFGASSTVGGWF